MEIDKTQFKGILSGIDLSIINQELVDFLLEKNVIIFYMNSEIEWQTDWFKELNEEETTLFKANDTSLEFPSFQYNNKKYQINDLILEDIYDIIEKNREHNSYFPIELEKIKIKQQIDARYDRNSKILYLKEEYNKRINEIPSNFYPTYLFFLEKNTSEGFKEWKEVVLNTIEMHSKTLLLYLTKKNEEDYYFKAHKDSEILFSQKYSGYSDTVKYWRLFFITKIVLEFINNNIYELEGNTAYEKIDNVKPLTPFELVCYIEKLRLESKLFYSLEQNKKLNHLNNITSGKNHNIESQLKMLEKLTQLDTPEYENLFKKKSAYSKQLLEISKVDYSNTRKAVREFEFAVHIPEDMETYNDRLYQKKYNEIQDKIKRTIDKLDIFFE